MNALPEKLDTYISERGGNLSGGQRQRISIAHRLTTLKNCDRILVIDNGRIAQEGKYEELIKVKGIFIEMYYGRLK